MQTPNLDRFSQASGFIFDCDGTLLDTMDAWRAVEEALLGVSVSTIDPELLVTFRSAPMSQTARMAHEQFGVMDSSEAVMEFIDAQMMPIYEQGSTLRTGAREFLLELRALDIPCALVSASPKRYLEAGMRARGLLDEFTIVLSTQEECLSKRDPAIYQLALDAMGAQAHSAWGVEDSDYAIVTMKDMGMSTIGIYDNDNAGSYDMLCKDATIAIHQFTELL